MELGEVLLSRVRCVVGDECYAFVEGSEEGDGFDDGWGYCEELAVLVDVDGAEGSDGKDARVSPPGPVQITPSQSNRKSSYLSRREV